ncbi:MAG: DUF4245 domain-containing protein [Candidatus Nanopelagicales bacterium]|nr:DUF4245 domain-containing protein [Candidatus Nanopelagicales bacterium]MDZ4249319.1 DUF4245 domain-containing protein [Candidatus Nanopelagicales bacterium]
MAERVAIDQGVTVARRGRGSGRAVSDIAVSMGLVTVAIVVLMVFNWRPELGPVRELDVQPVARLAAREASFPILLANPGPGWRSTSARWDPSEESMGKAVWLNGWVSPRGRSAAVVQSSATSQVFITEQTLGGQRVQSADWPWQGPPVGNDTWVAYENESGEQRSLVRVAPDQTIIVTGTGRWSDLTEFAGSLRPVDVRSRS